MLNALHPAHDCTTQRLFMVNRYTPVYEVVRTIPVGMVTTYGAIARAVIVPRGARGVGWALAVCDATLPWWRVVARDGRITSPHAEVQQAMLVAEGVPLSGELQVDIRHCLWLP
jgi:methylated-DNA-protein-cysteine methyltransferase-like protein